MLMQISALSAHAKQNYAQEVAQQQQQAQSLQAQISAMQQQLAALQAQAKQQQSAALARSSSSSSSSSSKRAASNSGIGAYAYELLRAQPNASNAELAAQVRAKFASATTKECIAWYRNKLKQQQAQH